MLDESLIEGEKLFRPAEYPMLLIIHESVKEELLTADLVGLEIIEPEEWDCFAT